LKKINLNDLKPGMKVGLTSPGSSQSETVLVKTICGRHQDSLISNHHQSDDTLVIHFVGQKGLNIIVTKPSDFLTSGHSLHELSL
jgi:hypothetical protein